MRIPGLYAKPSSNTEFCKQNDIEPDCEIVRVPEQWSCETRYAEQLESCVPSVSTLQRRPAG